MKRSFLLLFLCFLMLGCASSMNTQFQKVKVGMEKNDVLALMDSPQRTQRWHGMDRWTYIFYNEDQRQEMEVHFAEGRASYVGGPYVPALSADERDNRNEASNKEVADLMASQKQEARKAFSDYELHMKGQDTIRYVPQYSPVQ